MRSDGIIEATVALIRPEAIGLGLTVFISIQAPAHTTDWLSAFTNAVITLPEILEVYRMAGDVDYLLRVAVADMTAFDLFYRTLIDTIPMKNVSSHFAMEQVKRTTAYPL